MKKSLLKMAFLVMPCLLCVTNTLKAQCSGCTITVNGGSNTYNLSSGDIFCLTAGSFTGSINNFPVGAIICVSENAIFSPAAFNNAAGIINNYGTITFLTAISFNTGTIINNYGKIHFNAAPNINGITNINNKTGGVLSFSTSFSLPSHGTVINEGIIQSTDDFSTDNGSNFTNYGKVYTDKNLNPNGNVTNYGFFRAKGFINFNSNSNVQNYCTFLSDDGFNNNSNNTRNFGFIMVTGKNGFPNDLWQNNAAFYNGPSAIIQTQRFQNNSSITGSGNMRANTTTTNQGPFGNDGNGINFYDVTKTGAQTFDIQPTLAHASVSSTLVPLYDTNYIVSTCSAILAILPVKKVDITVINRGNENLISWLYENSSMQKTITLEKSVDGANFKAIKNIIGIEKGQYADILNTNETKVYYRLKFVDMNDNSTYSQIVLYHQAINNVNKINVYPNPVKDAASISINSTAIQKISIEIFDVSGKRMVIENRNLNKGINSFILQETKKLVSGVYLMKINSKNGVLIGQQKLLKQ